MRRACLLVLTTALVFLSTGCPSDADPIVPYRVGFNFISVGDRAPQHFDEADEILADLEALSAGGMRQLSAADVGWFTAFEGGEYGNVGNYDLAQTDLLAINNHGLHAVLTLFQTGPDVPMQHGAPDDKRLYTPDGERLEVDDPTVRAKVEDYVRVIASRYHPWVKHYEVANEVELLRKQKADDYVALMQCVRAVLDSVDPDLQVVMAGIWTSEEDYVDWLEDVLDEPGAEAAFDILNFHYYSDWERMRERIEEIQAVLAAAGCSKPIWFTEIGTSYLYRDEQEQCRDIFRKLSIAFGNGIELCNWHTHISTTDDVSKDWPGYGVRHANGSKARGWYAYRLFAEKLGEFASCSALLQGADDAWVFRFDGVSDAGAGQYSIDRRFVAWTDQTSGITIDLSAQIDAATVTCTEVVPDADGDFPSTNQSPSALCLKETPVLIEEPTLIFSLEQLASLVQTRPALAAMFPSSSVPALAQGLQQLGSTELQVLAETLTQP